MNNLPLIFCEFTSCIDPALRCIVTIQINHPRPFSPGLLQQFEPRYKVIVYYGQENMKLSSVTQAASLLLGSLLSSVHAWGGLGHETVAFIASSFVDQETQTFFQGILGDTSPEYLAKVATWADSFRYTKAGRFSEPYHFIDSKDSPPNSCSVSFSRDCGPHGCVVSAIQNYVRTEMTILAARTTDSSLRLLD